MNKEISKKDKLLTCQFCGAEFKANKRLGVNGCTLYNMKAKFCSRSCSAKSNKEQYSKTDILSRIEMCLVHYNTYCTKEVILDYIGISSKTLTKLGISVKDVNGQEGFFNHKDYFETEVYKFLLTKFKQEDVTREKTFPGMVYKNLLRVDFYIQSINTVIEADGAQHWDKTNRYYTELNATRDSIKEEYLQQNAIRLIRIPYKRNFSTSYFNSFI